MSQAEKYDLVIVGAGPAGLTASIYASRYKIRHVIVGPLPGGTMTEAHRVCNFPSEVEVNGWELSQKMENSAKHLGVEIIPAEVKNISGQTPEFKLTLSNGQELVAKSILLATGTRRRKLGLDNEAKFLGQGLAYCTTCDGAFFKDQIVGVIGGGNSAATSVLYLSDIAKRVVWFYLDEQPDFAEPAWLEEIAQRTNVQHSPSSQVIELLGQDRLSGVIVQQPQGQQQIELNGLFIEIGSDPNSDLMKQLGGQIDQRGYIITNQDQSTSVKGIWAAGDGTTSSNGLRQIVTACSEGAIAVTNIFSFLSLK